jgi:hypothetical protein
MNGPIQIVIMEPIKPLLEALFLDTEMEVKHLNLEQVLVEAMDTLGIYILGSLLNYVDTMV